MRFGPSYRLAADHRLDSSASGVPKGIMGYAPRVDQHDGAFAFWIYLPPPRLPHHALLGGWRIQTNRNPEPEGKISPEPTWLQDPETRRGAL